MYVCMYVCRYVRTYVCMYVYMYVGRYVRMYIRMYVFIYVHTYVCMYIHTVLEVMVGHGYLLTKLDVFLNIFVSEMSKQKLYLKLCTTKITRS